MTAKTIRLPMRMISTGNQSNDIRLISNAPAIHSMLLTGKSHLESDGGGKQATAIGPGVHMRQMCTELHVRRDCDSQGRAIDISWRGGRNIELKIEVHRSGIADGDTLRDDCAVTARYKRGEIRIGAPTCWAPLDKRVGECRQCRSNAR